MVNAQIDSSIMELNYSLQYQGFSIEQLLEMTGKSMQELRDERKEDAEKSVKASLVVDAIAKAENVEVSEEEVEAEVAKMAEAYNMTLPQIKGFRIYKRSIKNKKNYRFLSWKCCYSIIKKIFLVVVLINYY